MKPRHAATLALVGWYLMLPPNQETLDSSCSNHMGILDSLIYSLKMESDSDRIKRCDREATLLASDAPFSQWYQAEEFETLAECRAEQRQPTNGTREIANEISEQSRRWLRRIRGRSDSHSAASPYALEVPRQRRSASKVKSAINLHHAVPLALVGWYLILPPLEAVQLRPSKDGYTLDFGKLRESPSTERLADRKQLRYSRRVSRSETKSVAQGCS